MFILFIYLYFLQAIGFIVYWDVAHTGHYFYEGLIQAADVESISILCLKRSFGRIVWNCTEFLDDISLEGY